MKKSQSSLLILVSLVGIFLVMWIFFQFSSVNIQTRQAKGTILAKLSKYLDTTKAFTRVATILSGHIAANEVASKGGQGAVDETRSWICNAPYVPSVDEVKFFLANQTKTYLNYYLDNYQLSDQVVKINVSHVKCVSYPVDEGEVIGGKTDERYPVKDYQSDIQVSFRLENLTSPNEITDEVSLLRFWYMYRKFRYWAETYGPDYVGMQCGCLDAMCGCPRTGVAGSALCGNCPPYKKCSDQSMEWFYKKLVEVFSDEYVKCSYNTYCCYYEHIPCENVPDYCVPWEESPYCIPCKGIPAGSLCENELEVKLDKQETKTFESEMFKQKTSYTKGDYPAIKFQDKEEDVGRVWQSVKGAPQAYFECRDTKYFVSTAQGTKTLDFRVDVTTYFKRKGCIECVPCEFACSCDGC